MRQTETTLLVLGLNETLRETERTENTERRMNAGAVRYDSTHLVRDVNGRWQPIETRRGEAREIGASERMEEETIQNPDMNGKLAVDERNVTRRSTANEQDRLVVETYVPYADGLLRSDSRLGLSQRVRGTSRATADGGRHTVEEVESRSYVVPSDPMRVIRRTVTTVRQIGTDRWVTERQVFERDINGQLRLVINETEETGRGVGFRYDAARQHRNESEDRHAPKDSNLRPRDESGSAAETLLPPRSCIASKSLKDLIGSERATEVE